MNMRWLLMVLLFLGVAPLTHAQTTPRTHTLRHNGIMVALQVPASWIRLADTPSNRLEVRSEPELYLAGDDLQRIQLWIENGDSALIATEDRVATYLQVLQTRLSNDNAYPLEHFSEVVRFRWDGYEAGLFLAYGNGGDGIPAYYARWFALAQGDQIVVLEQGTALPQGTTPLQTVITTFDTMLAGLSINDEVLDVTNAALALQQPVDPITLAAPAVAGLRNSEIEVRVAAPRNWQRRDVSEQYPAVYFFEDDLRQLSTGEAYTGAFIQLSLLNRDALQALADGMPQDLEQGGLALIYLNSLLPQAVPSITLEQPRDLAWTPDTYAVIVDARYPVGNATHADGTRQQVWVIEVNDTLLVISLYTPSPRWEALQSAWYDVLSSVTVNGDSLPAEPIQDFFEDVPS